MHWDKRMNTPTILMSHDAVTLPLLFAQPPTFRAFSQLPRTGTLSGRAETLRNELVVHVYLAPRPKSPYADRKNAR